MLRIAIPYGVLSAQQMRTLASIARRYDRGYGHFTTRQNLQFNWIRIEDSPDILEELAAVEMHAIQTSGNSVRNITTDEFAGVAADELIDPRAFCEILRQWSSFHPEFTGCHASSRSPSTARARIVPLSAFHDIGLHLVRAPDGALGFRVMVVAVWAARRSSSGHSRILAMAAVSDVYRIDPARLQPPRAARQHPQGAYQDPSALAGHRRVCAPG
jgi:sulfite reductase (NADPH) hemoprotein beta-component